MLRPQGYAIIVDPDKGNTEHDTFTCAHGWCGGRVTHLKALLPAHEQGGFCRKCMALVCKDCAGKPCKPLMKQIEEWEKVGNMILAGMR